MQRRADDPERRQGRPSPDEAGPAPAIPEAGGTDHGPSADELFREFLPVVEALIQLHGASLDLGQDLRQELRTEMEARFRALVATFDPASEVPIRAHLLRILPTAVESFLSARRLWERAERWEPPPQASRGAARLPTGGDLLADWCDERRTSDILLALPVAIAALPERQRRVVLGRLYEGRTDEELAAELGIHLRTVRALLRHALQQLDRSMDEF